MSDNELMDKLKHDATFNPWIEKIDEYKNNFRTGIRSFVLDKNMVVSLILLFGVAVSAVAAEPGITVEARQRYPWNGLVDLKFTITGESSTKYDTSFIAKDMVGGTNIAMKTNERDARDVK